MRNVENDKTMKRQKMMEREYRKCRENTLHSFGLLFLSLILFLIISSEAMALGIAPSRKVVNYESEFTVQATLVNNDGRQMTLFILPQGEFAPYVLLDKNIIKITAEEGEVKFTYTVKVPKNATTPGQNLVRVAFIELPPDFKNPLVTPEGQVVDVGEKSAISATTAIVQQVVINVPFPDIYVDGRLYITGERAGEPVAFSVSLFNRGSKDTAVEGYVLVKGPTNEELAHISLGKTTLSPAQESRIVGAWTPEHTGEYYAEAYITYGERTFTLKEQFTVGAPFISIDTLRIGAFRLGTIAKFDVELSSKWNKMLTDIEGEMTVLNNKGGIVSSFETTRKDLPPYGSGTVTGYWDTAGVTVGEYDVNVKINAEGKTSQKTFPTVVSIDSIEVKEGQAAIGQVIGTKKGGSTTSLLIILVIVLIILNIGILLFFRKIKGALGKPPSPPQTPRTPPPPSSTRQAPPPATRQPSSSPASRPATPTQPAPRPAPSQTPTPRQAAPPSETMVNQ
jgi:hypothetical protein